MLHNLLKSTVCYRILPEKTNSTNYANYQLPVFKLFSVSAATSQQPSIASKCPWHVLYSVLRIKYDYNYVLQILVAISNTSLYSWCIMHFRAQAFNL